MTHIKQMVAATLIDLPAVGTFDKGKSFTRFPAFGKLLENDAFLGCRDGNSLHVTNA